MTKQLDVLPQHLGMILDGNRRWADKQGIERKRAIWYGIRKVEEILFEWTQKFVKEFGVTPFGQLTIYALTLQNIQSRPKEQLTELFDAFTKEIRKVRSNNQFVERGVKVKCGGSLHLLPQDLQKEIAELEKMTENGKNYDFFIPIAYDGNMEIKDAITKGGIRFENYLYFPNAKPLDLVIRTGGELRLSGFMLWYVGQAELFFTKTLPEDFTYKEFVEILREYAKRDRRFGK